MKEKQKTDKASKVQGVQTIGSDVDVEWFQSLKWIEGVGLSSVQQLRWMVKNVTSSQIRVQIRLELRGNYKQKEIQLKTE